MKVDLYALHKADYIAPKTPRLVKIAKAQYLAIDGAGAPGGEEFQESIGALYKVAYPLKFASKAAGQDYVVCKLEGLWWDIQPPNIWNWKLLIRTPDFITKSQVPKGKVKLETLTEGQCVQMLHVGPYDQVCRTTEIMRAFAEGEGLAFHGKHHEIYLSDPRRVAPEKLKTIVRVPVRK
jgi:hypothetical protein